MTLNISPQVGTQLTKGLRSDCSRQGAFMHLCTAISVPAGDEVGVTLDFLGCYRILGRKSEGHKQ